MRSALGRLPKCVADFLPDDCRRRSKAGRRVLPFGALSYVGGRLCWRSGCSTLALSTWLCWRCSCKTSFRIGFQWGGGSVRHGLARPRATPEGGPPLQSERSRKAKVWKSRKWPWHQHLQSFRSSPLYSGRTTFKPLNMVGPPVPPALLDNLAPVALAHSPRHGLRLNFQQSLRKVHLMLAALRGWSDGGGDCFR